MSGLARTVIAGAVIAAATMVAADTRQVRERDPDWTAPTAADSKQNPLASRPDARAGARKLFAERCTTCHGDDGRGTSKGPDLTQPDVQAQTDGALFWKISSGNSRAGMPTFSFLPEAQRWQLVLRLRSLTTE
jgi:mono/diheme cytochrome c family protein